jgi:hypothetical protein
VSNVIGYRVPPTAQELQQKALATNKNMKTSMNGDYGIPSQHPSIRDNDQPMSMDYENGTLNIPQGTPSNASQSRTINPDHFFDNQVNGPSQQFAMNSPPFQKYNTPGEIQKPQIPKEVYDELIRALDKGHDDYAMKIMKQYNIA